MGMISLMNGVIVCWIVLCEFDRSVSVVDCGVKKCVLLILSRVWCAVLYVCVLVGVCWCVVCAWAAQSCVKVCVGFELCRSFAQLVERQSHNLKVASSILAGSISLSLLLQHAMTNDTHPQPPRHTPPYRCIPSIHGYSTTHKTHPPAPYAVCPQTTTLHHHSSPPSPSHPVLQHSTSATARNTPPIRSYRIQHDTVSGWYVHPHRATRMAYQLTHGSWPATRV